jgi:hypothetical protein
VLPAVVLLFHPYPKLAPGALLQLPQMFSQIFGVETRSFNEPLWYIVLVGPFWSPLAPVWDM